ncbi:MAG TPA: response regulator transcription factor [Pyrinomonadaceae bacterium]|jgi:DNA-binding NarL/FixJ family response regulator
MPAEPTQTGATRPVRVAIVEDLAEIREGIGYLIGVTDGYELTGSFVSMEDALRRLGDDPPDVLLLDIGLPRMDGIEGARLLRERFPELSIVAMTVYDDDERIFRMLCAGASGYLLKKTPPARLLDALRDAARGGSPISPEVAARVIRLFRDFAPPPRADHNLTPHEARILKLLVDGHSYKTAAAELGSSVNTVAFHMRSIYRKLEVHSKSEAVAKALRQKLV